MVKDAADLKRFLPTIALFGGLQDGTLDKIVSMLTAHELQPGEEICKQGEVGRSMFVVRHGEVSVLRETDTGKRIRMIRLGAGEFFGEMTLIDIQKRSASILVEKPSLVYSLGNRELFRLYQEDVAGYVMVLQNLCRELSRRLRTTNVRLSQLADEADDDSTQIRPAIKRKPLSP